MFPTPATEEVGRDAQSIVNRTIPAAMVDVTPSRVTEETSPIFAPSADNSKNVPRSEGRPGVTTFASQSVGRENYTLDASPNPLSFMQSEDIPRISPPLRNPVIKAEDPGNAYGHSSVGQQSQSLPLVSTVSNG